MYSRIQLYKNYLKKMSRAGVRSILTLIGISMSVAVVFLTMTNAETLIASNYADIELYRDNAVCWTQLDYDYDVFDSIRETLPGTTFIEKLDNLSYNISGASVAGKNLTFSCVVKGVNAVAEGFVSEPSGSLQNRKSDQIIYGRNIDSVDVENCSNVMVIPSIMAKVLYGREDAVGESLSLMIRDENGKPVEKTFEVVGVVSSSKEYGDKVISDLTKDNLQVSFDVFIPMTTGVNTAGQNKKTMIIINYGENGMVCTEALERFLAEREIWTTVNDYETQKMYAGIIASDQKSTLITMLFIIIIFAGAVIMAIMFYSVKERVGEIGIRRTIGAYDADIIEQFLFEGFVYGVIGAIIGCIFGYFFSSANYIVGRLYVSCRIPLMISSKTVLLSCSLSVFISMLASFAPALYASGMSITDAFKNEKKK